MAINKKLIFWKSATFNPPTSSTDTTKDVLWSSIVFFGSTAGTYANSIWTHGQVFSAGTWGINQTNYVPLTLSGTTYNLSKDGHTHSYAGSATVGGVANSANTLENQTINSAQLESVTLKPGIYNAEGFTPATKSGSYHYIVQLGGYSGGGYRAQLAVPYQNGINDSMYIRTSVGATWGSWLKFWNSGNLTNNLTTNYLPKWTGSSLTNSILYDNGTNVGIGTTDPGAKLEVVGKIKGWTGGATNLIDSVSQSAFSTDYINNPGTGLHFGTILAGGGYVSAYIQSADNNGSNARGISLNPYGGNVGIGTTTPDNKLDIVGGSISTTNQLISTIASGTPPLVVTSTTQVVNLTAEYAGSLRVLDSNKSIDYNALSYGRTYDYGSGQPRTNGPTGMSYGSVYNFGGANNYQLSLQMAADINHNSVSSTRKLWFRTGNNLGFQNDWKEIYHSGNFTPTDYLPLTGDTMSGALVVNNNITSNGIVSSPVIKATSYFVTPTMVGEGDSSTYYHRLDFGYAGNNKWDFYEYGGIYNFYQNTSGIKTNSTLVFKIQPSGVTATSFVKTGGTATQYLMADGSSFDKPTTLSGYGITDAYTKTLTDSTFLKLSGGTMTGQINLTATTITTPPANTIALAAKSDGLYQKIGSIESKLSTVTESDSKYIPFTDSSYYAKGVGKGSYYRDVVNCSIHNAVYEILIKTKIPFISSSQMPLIHLEGYAYGAASPIELRIAFYIYNSTFVSVGCTSTCPWKPTIKLFTYIDGGTTYVGLALAQQIYFPQFTVNYIDVWGGGNGTQSRNYSLGWTTEYNTASSPTIIPTDNLTTVTYKPIANDISGNSDTATKLSSNRTFALTGDVTGTITSDLTSGFSIATTIAPNSVALGTDTTGNYAASVGVSGNGLTITGTAGEGTAFTVNSNATNANTGGTLVFRDAIGNFSAGTITAALSGNATTATSTTLVYRRGDHRSGFKPSDVPGQGLVQTFATQGALNSQTNDGDYSDVIAINSYQDSSAGSVNALSFDKSSYRINHFMGTFGATTWLGHKTLAYTDGTGASGNWGINITGTATSFTSDRTNYKGVTDGSVAGQLMWKNYGNHHTIFDASNSTTPSNTSCNNTDSVVPWATQYPVLMGWNGSHTYGVRVDSARLADNATNILNNGTVTLASGAQNNSIFATTTSLNSGQPVRLLNFDWFSNIMSIGNIRAFDTNSLGFGFYYTASGGSLLEIGRLTKAGALSVISTMTATAFYESSDMRLKTNIKSLDTDVIDLIFSEDFIKSFNWKENNVSDYGVIAQHIESYFPDLVSTSDTGFKHVKYSAVLSMIMGASIKKIKSLEERITNLENK